MLHLPYSTSTKGLYSELGMMTIKSQILKRKLMFLHRILNKPDTTLSKAVMLEQEYLPGNNWLKNVKNNIVELKIENTLNEITNLSKPQWKKIIIEALHKKEADEFEIFIKNSKKCKHLKNIELKNYIQVLTPEKAKLILEVRLGILDVKENYHGKYQDTICRNCSNEIETAKHFFECNTQELTGPIENIEEIWKLENMKSLKEVAEHCMKIMEMNEHIHYKTI